MAFNSGFKELNTANVLNDVKCQIFDGNMSAAV